MKSDSGKKRTIFHTGTRSPQHTDFQSKYKKLLAATRLLKERKKDLQQAFAEIEDIYNHAPCGYYSLNEQGIFIRINDTALQWLGETRKAFAGIKRITDILTPESRELFRKTFPLFLQTGVLKDAEFDFVRRDGSIFPVLVNATAVYDNKGIFRMSRSVIMDITGRRIMEQQLRLSHRELQQKNDSLTMANENLFLLGREKDRFMDIASHDLQLPLSAISMMSEALLKNNIPSGSPEEKQIFGMIHDASLEMRSLLANYLSASLSDTGHMDLFLAETDLNLLIGQIINRYIPVASKKNISLHIKHDRNIMVFTDRECCTQIIENLLSNAIKYTAHGKNVTVTVSRSDEGASISIADEGPGISPEDKPLLFQRFKKLSARPTGGELSTGLGLSIVKYLVEQLKGRITVETEPGKGSRFTVELPAGEVP